jgi:hypothetical protein
MGAGARLCSCATVRSGSLSRAPPHNAPARPPRRNSVCRASLGANEQLQLLADVAGGSSLSPASLMLPGLGAVLAG